MNEVEVETESDLNLNSSKIDHTPKSTKELLHNLSEILNNTTRSDQQRSEGQHLLNSLAELLSDRSNSGNCNLDDSGHSSSINETSLPDKINSLCFRSPNVSQKITAFNVTENQSAEEALKITAKSKLCDRNSNRLSLSLHSTLPTKATQPKLLKRGSLSKISLNSSKNKTGSANCSAKSQNLSGGNVWIPQLQGNMKVIMKPEATKKGPLKATIPMKELKKSGKI